jgi:phospholipase C
MRLFVLFLLSLCLILHAGCGSSPSPSSPSSTPPPPPPAIVSPFAHIVVIIQENRTPDNLFQSMAAHGADISPYGICHNGTAPCAGADSKGVMPLTQSGMVTNYDIGHAYGDWTLAFHGGAMDGFSKQSCSSNCPPNAAYQYVQPSDIQPYIQLAQTYAFADRMFQSNKGPSLPGHLFLTFGTARVQAGSTALNSSNSTGYCAYPSPVVGTWTTTDQKSGAQGTGPACMEASSLITDQIESKGLNWKYYLGTAGNSYFYWWGPAYVNHICCGVTSPLTCPAANGCPAAEYTNHVSSSPNRCSGSTCTGDVLNDIANCKLPSVAWVTPSALASDHPATTDGSGPSWVAAIVNAIGTSSCTSGNWNDTAILLTWDDWGGFYDHVSPDVQAGYAGLPAVANSAYPVPQSAGPTSTYNTQMYGFRVPLIAISKYARPGVSHVTHDFGSILTFIEQTFGLAQMGDASSGTASTTWNADGLAAARGDYLLDMFNFSGNLGFTAVSKLEHFAPIGAPLPPEWFLAEKPHIKLPAIDSDLDDEPLKGADLARFDRFRQRSMRIVRAAVLEQETGIKRLKLQQDVTSSMRTGMRFEATDITGKVFTGHIVVRTAESSVPRSQSLLLAFDEPLTILSYGRTAYKTSLREASLGDKQAAAPAPNRGNEVIATSPSLRKRLNREAADVRGLMLVSKTGDIQLRKGQAIEVRMEKRRPE